MWFELQELGRVLEADTNTGGWLNFILGQWEAFGRYDAGTGIMIFGHKNMSMDAEKREK